MGDSLGRRGAAATAKRHRGEVAGHLPVTVSGGWPCPG